MDAVATQEWARMLSWSMAIGGIGIGSVPREDGSAIDNQIACANQPSPDSGEYIEDKECFWQGSSSTLTALALLRSTGDAWTTIFAHW
jgi:hypothetical protein